MNVIPLVRVNAFLPFLKFLNHIGSPTDRLLEQVKLPVFALDDPEALLPLYQSFVFIEQAAKIEKIEMFGILVGQQTQITDLGIFGHLLHQTLTLYDLLCTIERMIASYNSGQRAWLVEEGDRVWLHNQYTCPSAIENQQARLYDVMLYLKAIQLATGKGWQPLELRFRSDYSRKFTEIEEFANVPLHFNQPTDAIAIPKALLCMPLQPSRAFQTLSPRECCQQLQASAPSSDLSKSLQQLLQSLLRDSYPDISLAAEAAGVSVRSFQRRLAEVNLSYSRIVEQVRFDRAIYLLHQPTIQLIDIAFELGYTDAANFTRAFKRWTGISPREFRCLHVNH